MLPLGTLIHLFINYKITGDPLYFLAMEETYWQQVSVPFYQIGRTFQSIFSSGYGLSLLTASFIPGLVCLLFSAGIETVQLLTGIGLFEFDDMISNTLGGLIGGLLYYVWKTGKRKMERGRKRHHGETALNSF